MPGKLAEQIPGTLLVPIETAVREALRCSGYHDLHSLEVVCVDGRIRVAGAVRTYYLKQKVQIIAMSVIPGLELQNEVVVQ